MYVTPVCGNPAAARIAAGSTQVLLDFLALALVQSIGDQVQMKADRPILRGLNFGTTRKHQATLQKATKATIRQFTDILLALYRQYLGLV